MTQKPDRKSIPIRQRWFKYTGIKPERGRGRVKADDEAAVASLNDLEAEAMGVLWGAAAPLSPMDVFEKILYSHRERGEEPASFPALQSTLRRLTEKSLLETQRAAADPIIRYAPIISREEMAARILNTVALKLLGHPLAALLPKITDKDAKPHAATPEDDARIDRLSQELTRLAAVSKEPEKDGGA